MNKVQVVFYISLVILVTENLLYLLSLKKNAEYLFSKCMI